MTRIIPLICAWFSLAIASAEIRFSTDHLSLRSGESAMVAITDDGDPGALRSPECRIEGTEVLKLLREPQILAGEKTGFLRVRALKPGQTKLTVAGKTIKVTVTDEPLIALLERMRPQITAPAERSACWGKVSVGAEIWVGAPGLDRTKVPAVKLVLNDKLQLDPVEALPPVDGPFWRLRFEVDCDALEPGSHDWKISYTPEVAGMKSKQVLLSGAHEVNVLASPGKDEFYVSGECEDTLGAPRGERIGKEPPGVGFDQEASGARFVNLWGYRPEWAVEFEIPKKARYQLMMRVKGTLAGSAYPSIEVLTAEDGRRKTTARLASGKWHRVPVGPPFSLDAGKQVLAVRMANDFNYRNRVNRDAFADQYELREVPATSGGDGSAMAMMGGSMAMMDGGEKAAESAKKGKAPSGLRVGFREVIDGQNVVSAGYIRGVVRAGNYRNDKEFEQITTALLINGTPFRTEKGRYQNFRVLPHDLKLGKNTLQLLCVGPGGRQAMSKVQTIISKGKSHPKSTLETKFNESHVWFNQGNWSGAKREKLKEGDPFKVEKGPEWVAKLGNGEGAGKKLIHKIPDHINGDLRLSVHARSHPDPEMAACPLRLKVVVHGKKKREINLGVVQPGDSWKWQAVKRFNLPKGRKDLVIEALPAEGKVGISGLSGYSWGSPEFVDVAAPEIALRYPKSGAVIHPKGDALIAEVFDDREMSYYFLKVDGERHGLPQVGNEFGLQLIPFETSELKPGAHEVQLVAVDKSGKQTASQPVKITIPGKLDPKKLTLPYERAIRLSERMGFGADRNSLIGILLEGEEGWIEQQINAGAFELKEELAKDLAGLFFADPNDYQVRGRVISHALTTQNPVRARFVLWAQNHFSVWMAKTGSRAKWIEHEGFVGAGMARFNDLLLTSATSPAMMTFLDQQNSLGRQLNENYAREILELHTVGVGGGYDQEDVTALAHLLTGWGAQREATMAGNDYLYRYRFSPFLNEEAPREVFGLSVAASDFSPKSDDRILQFLEMLASRPETASFVCRKLASHYFATVPEPLLPRLESKFLETQGDFGELLQVIATSPELMQRELEPKFLKPVEFGIAVQRTADSYHPWHVINLGDRAGRNLFDRSTPDGYPEANSEYSGSNFQLQKWRFAKDLEGEFGDALAWSWFDKEPMQDPAHREKVIRNAALVLLRQELGPNSFAAAKKVMEQAAKIEDHNQRRRLLAVFLEMLPENQSR